MGSYLTISKILAQFMSLSLSDRRALLKKLVDSMNSPGPNVEESKTGLAALEGLGADIWRGVDVESFIRNERKWD